MLLPLLGWLRVARPAGPVPDPPRGGAGREGVLIAGDRHPSARPWPQGRHLRAG